MQFTLMDFQTIAVEQTLKTLRACRRDWREDRERSAFSLSAPTGSGKTVIASTVIEALLHGSDTFEMVADPTAVVLWVTKDPALNQQTLNRIIQTADRVPPSSLHIIDNSFTESELAAGNIYFINTSKLSVNSLLVRKTDGRQTTFWEVLDNTIKNPQRTLYVILDEAHEGMKPPSKADETDRLTLVRKLIDGDNGYAGVPVVWGLSATVERFKNAMQQTGQRTMRTPVTVTAQAVQISGLLKSSLQLTFPDEVGDFTTTLLRDAAIELAAVTDLWTAYCENEAITPAVRPLMVVQIPNKDGDSTDSEDRQIRLVLDTIKSHLPGFDTRQVGHVLSDRDTIALGDYVVPKVPPEQVQDDPELRILIAKDAVSTGWDCPRAEVLVSLRPAKDRTYITQLLGRMVRTPLARSTSDGRLNSAAAYLPLFDRKTAITVADDIMGKGSDGGTVGPDVILKPLTLIWNPKVPVEVMDVLLSLPSLPKPAAAAKPIQRMLKMAGELAHDKLVTDPTDIALDRMIDVLDGILYEYRVEVAKLAGQIRKAELRRVTVDLAGSDALEDELETDADDRAVEDAVRFTKRILGDPIVKAWLRRKYTRALETDPNTDLTLLQARLASLSMLNTKKARTVQQRVEDAADERVEEWFDLIRRDRETKLNEDRKAAYDTIELQSRTPVQTTIKLGTGQMVDTVDADINLLPTVELHVLSGPDGKLPLPKANSWEAKVLSIELDPKRNANVAGWYRNPASGKAALQIAYQDAGGGWHSVQPDFLLFETRPDGSFGCSIVDPHSHHLADALAKLQALAKYAAAYGDRFHRIDAVAVVETGEPMRVLAMHKPEVREAVLAGTDAKELFKGKASRVY